MNNFQKSVQMYWTISYVYYNKKIIVEKCFSSRGEKSITAVNVIENSVNFSRLVWWKGCPAISLNKSEFIFHESAQKIWLITHCQEVG